MDSTLNILYLENLFRVRKGRNKDRKPKFQNSTTSNVKGYFGQAKNVYYSTLRILSSHPLGAVQKLYYAPEVGGGLGTSVIKV